MISYLRPLRNDGGFPMLGKIAGASTALAVTSRGNGDQKLVSRKRQPVEEIPTGPTDVVWCLKTRRGFRVLGCREVVAEGAGDLEGC